MLCLKQLYKGKSGESFFYKNNFYCFCCFMDVFVIVERFTQNMINSGLFRLYIASGFFATSVFFVINAELFSPLEMILGVIGVTIALKGITNLMLSMIILLFSLDNKKSELDFNYQSERIETLLSELQVNSSKTDNTK